MVCSPTTYDQNISTSQPLNTPDPLPSAQREPIPITEPLMDVSSVLDTPDEATGHSADTELVGELADHGISLPSTPEAIKDVSNQIPERSPGLKRSRKAPKRYIPES